VVVDEFESGSVGRGSAGEFVWEAEVDPAHLLETVDLLGWELDVDGAEAVLDLRTGAGADDRNDGGSLLLCAHQAIATCAELAFRSVASSLTASAMARLRCVTRSL
jgi:hypothetical protein